MTTIILAMGEFKTISDMNIATNLLMDATAIFEFKKEKKTKQINSK